MPVNAVRKVVINLTGDIILDKEFEAAENEAAPGSVTLYTLTSGANTITVPSASGVTVKAATIIPPAGNEESITLKGVSGDTGVVISSTDPTSIAFETAPASFVLSVGDDIDGLRIVWT